MPDRLRGRDPKWWAACGVPSASCGNVCSVKRVKDDIQAASDLVDALLSMGETKLGIQATTSIGYDTQALGLMAVAVALAGVNVALMGALGVLWWLPLGGLSASLAIGVAALAAGDRDRPESV